MKGHKKNNSGGATQPKSGVHLVPLCRGAGYSATMQAMQNRTRTRHPHTDKHYRYEGAGEGTGGNVHGWSPE